jgi:molybdenum cofactor synthesis domain-containing protein
LKEHTKFADSTIVSGIVPDEVVAITKWLTDNIEFCDVILTTGGTGFSARDVTPEATRAVIQRPCPGIVVALLKAGLDQTPMAALSRQEAGKMSRLKCNSHSFRDCWSMFDC